MAISFLWSLEFCIRTFRSMNLTFWIFWLLHRNFGPSKFRFNHKNFDLNTHGNFFDASSSAKDNFRSKKSFKFCNFLIQISISLKFFTTKSFLILQIGTTVFEFCLNLWRNLIFWVLWILHWNLRSTFFEEFCNKFRPSDCCFNPFWSLLWSGVIVWPPKDSALVLMEDFCSFCRKTGFENVQKKEKQRQQEEAKQKYGAWGSTFKNKDHFSSMHLCWMKWHEVGGHS